MGIALSRVRDDTLWRLRLDAQSTIDKMNNEIEWCGFPSLIARFESVRERAKQDLQAIEDEMRRRGDAPAPFDD
jgi:hypothetical protein